MNEKIQTRLEVKKIWADLASYAERKIEDETTEIKWNQDSLNEEEAKPEEERASWRIEDYKGRIANHERTIKAIQQVQEQILKIVG